MNTFTPVVILSPEKNDTTENNQIRHLNLQAFLKQQYFSFKTVKGMYKGKVENSYVITLKNEECLSMIKAALFNYPFGQESILYVDANRAAKLIYHSGEEKELGRFKPVDKSVASKLDAYTYDHNNDTYYACL